MPNLKSVFYATTVLSVAASAMACAAAAAELPSAERTIGFVGWQLIPAINWTEAKTECPDGLNDGPREQFQVLFPKNEKKWTAVETQLAREGATWLPEPGDDKLPLKEPVAKTVGGMNLDGKVDANDYVSPSGEQGIDNQLYRTVGCVANFRGPDGPFYWHRDKYFKVQEFNRLLMELTEVDSLSNDDAVVVTLYRGYDPLLSDASGEQIFPYSTHRADHRYGKEFIQSYRGKIVDGVLTTEPGDVRIPWQIHENVSSHLIRDWRLNVNLSPEGAEGMWAGYADIESLYYAINQSLGTHFLSYGGGASVSLYAGLRKNADAHPDPKTGENTAISAAFNVKFKRAYIIHPPQAVVSQSNAYQRQAAAK